MRPSISRAITIASAARAAARPLGATPIIRSAAAAAPSSSPSSFTSSSPRKFLRKAATSTSTSTSTPSSQSSSRTSIPSAPSGSPSLPSYEEDFPLPSSAPETGDYANLINSETKKSMLIPTPSPPLTSLPGAGYTPLPSVPGSAAEGSVAGGRFAGEAPGMSMGGVGSDDWSTSFKGLSERPFEKEVSVALLRPLEADDVEIKPDGLLYLPEIKYRRTLNAAFGPGGWGMAPRGETNVGPRIVSREWGLVCLGRLVAIARGEQEYFDPSGVPTAIEACKSNALMRCCKDLGIASELWDPRFIREFKAKHCTEVMVEHVVQKKKRKLWRKKDAKFEYPYKEIGK